MDVASFLEQKKNSLFEGFRTSYDQTYGVGTINWNIYDTAWISMVKREIEGAVVWTFPEAFHALLRLQGPDGSWSHTPSELDSITCTLTALLALQKHANDPNEPHTDLKSRITKAEVFLQTALKNLDNLLATSILPVGIELWLPALLVQLEQHGLKVNFGKREFLAEAQTQKLLKLDFEAIVNGPQSSALHSLEAFIGRIDFTRLSHQKMLGSMFASPSATAAYLIDRSGWDEEAESYIWHAVRNGAGNGSGLVGGVFPTTVFEWSWVTANLLRYGIEPSDKMKEIGKPIKQHLKSEGLIGLAIEACPDADDTARVATIVALQGEQVSLQGLLDRFERKTHFATYLHEKHASTTTNANVLISLISLSIENCYQEQIEKCARYLCMVWWKSDRMAQDKWNVSPYYPTMLICEALMLYLENWSKGNLEPLSEELMKFYVPLTLFQCLFRTLVTQNADGSWGSLGSCEETAYALLVLKNVAPLSFGEPILDQLKQAIKKGCHFILNRGERSLMDDQLWIDKTLYAIRTVSDSYILAGVNANCPVYDLTEPLRRLVDLPAAKITKSIKYFARLPCVSNIPPWVLEASIIEAFLFKHKLKTMDLFSLRPSLKDNYLELTAFVWAVANNAQPGCLLSASVIYGMIEFSVILYQLDTYMDTFIAKSPDSGIDRLALRFNRFYDSLGDADGVSLSEAKREPEINLKDEHEYLEKFFRFIFGNPLVFGASEYDKRNLRNEAKDAILTSLEQAKDHNALESSECFPEVPIQRHRQQSFYSWLQQSAIHSVLVPLFAKHSVCQIGRGQDVFMSVKEKYLAEELWKRFAVQVRLANDYGGIAKDRKAANLNAVNFSEFWSPEMPTSDGDLRSSLDGIFEFERKCTAACMDDLRNSLEKSGQKLVIRWLQVHYFMYQAYCDICYLYAFSPEMQ